MKKQYKVRNWKEYNNALKQRGSLTFWIEDGFEKTWYDSSIPNKRGRPFTYSESCIKILATLRYVFKKALRQLEGFVSSLFEMAGIKLKVPEFSRLSRRVGEALSKFQFPKPETDNIAERYFMDDPVDRLIIKPTQEEDVPGQGGCQERVEGEGGWLHH